MTKQDFLNIGDIKIFYTFKNDLGQEYILYSVSSIPFSYFITGDKLEWEPGFILSPHLNFAYQEFSLSSNEIGQLRSYFNS